jgi:hypothetical protein
MPLDYCYNSQRNHVLNPVPDPTVAQAWAIAFLANNSDVVSKLLDPVRVLSFDWGFAYFGSESRSE